MSGFGRAAIAALLLVLFLLHQDLWWWNASQRLLGLPIGLTFHLLYCGLVSAALWWVVRRLDAPRSQSQ